MGCCRGIAIHRAAVPIGSVWLSEERINIVAAGRNMTQACLRRIFMLTHVRSSNLRATANVIIAPTALNLADHQRSGANACEDCNECSRFVVGSSLTSEPDSSARLEST